MLALTSGRRWALEAVHLVPPRVRLAVGFAGIMAMLLVMAAGRGDQQPERSLAFSERWADVPMRIIPVSRQIRTVTILPETAVTPPMPDLKVLPPDIPPPPRVKRAHAVQPQSAQAHDICRGRGRVYTRGGKSWRCRR
jgi:hypothetical protein